jgi:xylose isomerase
MSQQKEYFPTVKTVKYEGTETKNPLAFRYYNAEEVILGKKMKDHLRFAVCYWHTWRAMGTDPFGGETRRWSFDDGTNTVENAITRLHAHFEFLQKLGVEYYTFHDRDIAPEGSTYEETLQNLDKVIDEAEKLQKATGIKLLWGTANLFSHPRYMNGAATNPDPVVFAHAAAQVKKAIEVTKRLGGENYVFWGGREGYQSLLNTNLKREVDHLARFLKLASDFKKKIGFKGTLLIEPKPMEPTKHQYDFDVATVSNFLRTYNLQDEFKLNIEANHATLAGHTFEHELATASAAGLLGSVDANTGDTLLGWDTDQFNLDIKSTTLAMAVVLDQGGLGTGGFNFDAKIRRESTDPEDLFYAHIGSMDAFARGLRIAAKIKEEGRLSELVSLRYSGWDSGLGADIEAGKLDLEALEKYVATSKSEPKKASGRQELFELLLNSYL